MVNGLSDRSAVVFDDERVVVNAGIVLAVTLGRRLGIEALVDSAVRLGARPGASRPGRKVLSLIHAMLLGADCIDDCDVLRAGRTEAVLGHKAMAPSTLGTFLRAFTFGHVRQLDRVLGQALRRAWAAGAGPGTRRLVIDIDSFVGEVHGHAKQGAGYGYTRKLGYHPILATRADTSEVLHVRLRRGQANTQRGALRSSTSCWPASGAPAPASAGRSCCARTPGSGTRRSSRACASAAARSRSASRCNRSSRARIALIDDAAWQPVADYPDSGVCELAETTLGAERLIVRRVHLHAHDEQTELFSYWRHHAFITNRTEPMHEVDAEHRQHAQVELVIRDLKDQALAHFPSGHYSANGAWTVIACLAHNLGRWSALVGLSDPTPRAAATIRRRLFALPGRLTRTARQWTLHLPARWPWAQDFTDALTRIRALPHPA